jgi:hypothetical protein
LSLSLLRLLDALRALANAEGVVEATVAQLAGTLGNMSDRQVQRLLRDLTAAGRLEALRTSGGRGRPAQYRVVKGDISGAERVTCAAPEGGAEPERVTPHVTLSAPKGDIRKERVTQDVALSPFVETPPFPPCPPLPPAPPIPPISPNPFLADPDEQAPPARAQKGDKDATLSRPQNRTVRCVEEVYERGGAVPPAASVAVTWANKIGLEPLLELLDQLAAQGHLADKPQAYVHKCVMGRVGRPVGSSRPVAGGAPGVDRRRLDQAAALGSRRGGAA